MTALECGDLSPLWISRIQKPLESLMTANQSTSNEIQSSDKSEHSK